MGGISNLAGAFSPAYMLYKAAQSNSPKKPPTSAMPSWMGNATPAPAPSVDTGTSYIGNTRKPRTPVTSGIGDSGGTYG